MKIKYLIIIIILILVAVGFEVLIFCSPLGQNPRLEKAIQSIGIFVALLAAVIALSSSDIPKSKIKAKVLPNIIKDIKNWKITHKKQDMTTELQDFFINCPDPVVSYKVQFKIINTSNFDWVKPVVTFWLPLEKQHPRKSNKGDKIWTSLGYHSNTYNTQIDLKVLEMVDGFIISNSNLPHWTKNRHITIWIRMVLDNCGSETFPTEVSIDCENAVGFTETIYINPSELLKGLLDTKMDESDDQTQIKENGIAEKG